jgi:hypothetical protein
MVYSAPDFPLNKSGCLESRQPLAVTGYQFLISENFFIE